jgi:hypothetical protein
MKKIILILAAIALFSSYSFAQSGSRFSLSAGPKLGVNISNVYDSQGEEFNANNKFGFVAGAFLTVPFGRYLGIQPEVLFSQKGFSATGKVLGTDYQFTRTSNFIDIPLLITIKPTSAISLVAGPQFSYLLKQTDEFSNTVLQEEFNNDNIRKNILCFTGGVDLNLDSFVFGARAGWDVTQNNGDGTSTTPRYKNVWYQFTIGFRIYN